MKHFQFHSRLDESLNMKNPNSYKFPFKLQKGDADTSDNFVVTNLMAELAIAMNTKLKLQTEITQLKLENEEMCKNQLGLENKILEEKNKCTHAINALQEQLNNKDIKLKQHSLEEMNEYISQVNDLKTEINNLKDKHANVLRDFEVKMKTIEDELLTTKRANEELLQYVQALKERANKYRNKFKFAVSLLQKMNKILQYFYQKRTTSSKKVQTEMCTSTSDQEIPPEPKPKYPPKSQDTIYDNIISELFFKPNPFCENLENIFFLPQEYSRRTMLK